jgi:hypothetical protein
MTRGKSGIRHLSRPLSKPWDEILDAFDEASTASPRAAAILVVALVEDTLRWSIGAYLRSDLTLEDDTRLFERQGAPLSSFHSKIEMAYALGVYGPVTRKDLLKLKEIRNAFAHSPHLITFHTPDISQECLRLSYLESRRTVLVETDPRERFLTTARSLILDLHLAFFDDAAEIP